MKASLLIKICSTLFYNCKNKVISLTFYESYVHENKKAFSRSEFDENLPSIYYVVEIASNKKVLSVMQRNKGADQDLMLSHEEEFDFNDLGKNNISEYTAHYYRESSPFSKESKLLNKQGNYKFTEECLKHEVSLFVVLFRSLGETVSLLFRSCEKLFNAHYIDGKLFIVEINEWALTVRKTDFYSLNRILTNFELVDFVPYPNNMTMKNYLNRLQSISQACGLIFEKFPA